VTQDATPRTGDGSELERLRQEVAEARHHLLTVQDHIVGLEAENGRLNRDLIRVTAELRQLRKRVKNLTGQRDDLRAKLQDVRTRVAQLEGSRSGGGPSLARRAARRVRSALR
jgi:uncharacterized protein (DUF3084 family)